MAIAPFGIVIKHKERWQYLNRNRTSELDPVYLLSSSKTASTHFCCIRTKQIHRNLVWTFPYFTSALLKVASETFLTVIRRWLKSNWMFFFNPFQFVGGGGGRLWAVSKVKRLAVYPAGKLHWHYTCTFNLRHSLWLPFVAAFAVMKGLTIHAKIMNCT